MLACIIQEKQLIVELVLVLLLLFLPDHHLILLSLRVLVDAVSEIAALFLNVLYLSVESSLNLKHFLLDDQLDISFGQALCFRLFLTRVFCVEYLTILLTQERLLKINFEL